MVDNVENIFRAAIEASVYVAPATPGLTAAELLEVGKRIGLKDGEMGDALPKVVTQRFGGRDDRLLLATPQWHMCGYLIYKEDPDLRNPEAFDFVVRQLNELTREVGASRAKLDWAILVDRAVAAQLPRHDVEVAITLMELSKVLSVNAGLVQFNNPQSGTHPLPSASITQSAQSTPWSSKKLRAEIMPHVRDVIERRNDGRPKAVEPFGALGEKLQLLGHGHLRLWWSQLVAELGRADPATAPLSTLVLAAAIVEGVLSFTVKHARSLGAAAFGSSDFDKNPKAWKLDDMVASAARGGQDAVLDAQTKNRADGLVLTRQRIHAGRMISEFPGGVPDLRPEEAREAKATAEQVVRRVLDWLETHPPQQV